MTRRTLIIAVLLVGIGATALFADGKTNVTNNHGKSGLGVSVGHWGFSGTAEIDGGSYLSVSFSMFLCDWAIADAGYCTEITPTPFHDHIVFADLLARVVELNSFGIVVGPIYLSNLRVAPSGNYLGAKLIPIDSWKSLHDEESKITVSLLSISVLYGMNSREYLWFFSLLDIQFFF